MSNHQFDSYEDFLRAVNESKSRYNQKKLELSWKEKLKILVKLQEKAYATGKLRMKPWPLAGC